MSVITQTSNLKVLVHNYLATHVKNSSTAGMFKVCTYDSDYVCTVTGETLTPANVRIGEINGSYAMSRTKSSRLLERKDWFWQLYLSFTKHVDLETFKATLEEGLAVPINWNNAGNPTVFIDILEYDIKEPVQGEQGSSSGTQALYRFNAAVSRSR